MFILLDTNVVSYLMQETTLSEAYRLLTESHSPAISFVTFAELYRGAVKAKWGMKRMGFLEQTLESYRVLHSTPEVCQWWAVIRNERRKQPISSEDAWIAATALAYDLTLVTHDAGDFQNIRGLRILTAERGS